MTSKSKISNLLKGKSVPNLATYSLPWTKQDKELMKAVKSMDVKKVNTILMKKSVITTKLGPNGKSVFHCACEVGNKEILDLILSKTLDVNDSTFQGITALHTAAANGDANTVDKLIKHHASVDKKDSNKMTALHLACAGQHLECVKILLSAGADPQSVDQGGKTPLHYAAHSGGPNGVTICTLLLEKGAQVNWQDKDRGTCLMLAARGGHGDVCTLLINHSARADLRDKAGLTAAEHAQRNGHSLLQEIFDRVPVKISESISEQGSYTPSESGSASHDQSDGMSPVFITHSGNPRARLATSPCDDESFSRTDVHSLHSFHSMDDELLTQHKNTSSVFLPDFSSHLEQSYNDLKLDNDKLSSDYKNVSIENIRLKDKLAALQMKLGEIQQNESNKVKKLEEQIFVERQRLEDIEKKLHESLSDKEVKDLQDEATQCDGDIIASKINLENLFNDDHSLDKLKTQILALKQENDHLKANKTQEDSFSMVNGDFSMLNGSTITQYSEFDSLHYENEIKALQEKIAQLQEEKTSLELTKSMNAEDLLQQNSVMASELEELRQEVTSLRESLPTEDQRFEALISQNFEEVNFDEEGFVDGRDMTKEEFLQGQNQQLKAQCHLLTEELVKLRTTFDAILKAGDNLQTDYDQLAAEKDAIQDDLEAALKEKQSIVAENEYLLNDTNELHDNLNKLVHELEKMQEKYQAAQVECEHSVGEVSKLLEERNAFQEKCLDLQAECEDLKRSVTVASKVGEVSRLLEERDALQEKCLDLQEFKDRLQHDHSILLEEVQSLTEEVNQLSIDKEQLTNELEDTCQQLDTLQNDFNQLENDFGELLHKKELLESRDITADQKDIIIQLKEEVSLLKKEKEVLEFQSKEEKSSAMSGIELEEITIDADVAEDSATLLQLKKDVEELMKEKEILKAKLYAYESNENVEVGKNHSSETSKVEADASKEQFLKLQNDLEEVKKEKQMLKDQLKMYEVKNSEIVDRKNEKVKNLTENSQEEMVELVTTVNQLSAAPLNNKIMPGSIGGNNAVVDRAMFLELKKEYEELLKEKEMLEEQLYMHELQIEDMTQASYYEAEIQVLKENFDELLKQKEGLEEQKEGLVEQLQSLEIEKESLEEQLNEIRRAPNGGDEKLLLLEADLAKLCREKQMLESTLKLETSADMTKLQQLEDEFAELLREKEDVEAKYNHDHEDLVKLRGEYKKLLDEKATLEERYQLEHCRLQELEQKLAQYLEADHNKGRDEDFHKLRTDYQELLSEKEELENVVHGLSRHNVAIEKKMKNLQSSLAEAKAAINPVSHQEVIHRLEEEITALKKQIAQLTADCAEWEKRHADTVSTYRTHLLSAVQGHMDPDVKEALFHIIEIRSMEQFC